MVDSQKGRRKKEEGRRQEKTGSTLLLLSSFFLLSVTAQKAGAPPSFAVDPLWPKPMGNHWLLGSVTGIAVDAQDHLWVVHRGYDSFTARTEIGLATNPKTAEDCCVPAPFVRECATEAAGRARPEIR